MTETVNTVLASHISHVGEADPLYDKNAKELLADVQILARIVKHTLNEFKNMPLGEVISCIANVKISEVSIEPGLTNASINKLEQEDSVANEGTIFYDIRFDAIIPEGNVKIILNVEAQKDINPGYPLENRIIFYLSRMISAQKDTEFFHSDYENIKKVVSIWICAGKQDSIEELSVKPGHIFGAKRFSKKTIDLIQAFIIQIRPRKDVDESKDSLIAMLEDLLRKEPASEKKKILEEKHNLKMTTELERKVNDMCNLSQLIREEGFEDGFEDGQTKKAKEIVKRMLKDNMSLEQIAKYSEMGLKEIQEIKDSLAINI